MGFTSVPIIHHDQWGCLRVTEERQGKQGQPKGEGTLTAYSYIPTAGPCIDIMWHGLCPRGGTDLSRPLNLEFGLH